jgi:alpha-mannosidase
VVGATIGDAVREGYSINLPSTESAGTGPIAPLFRIDNDAVVASAVKLADDGSGDVILRVYESLGGRAAARVVADFDFVSVAVCDLLERPWSEEADASVTVQDGSLALRLRPFQLVTLRFTRSAAGSLEAAE